VDYPEEKPAAFLQNDSWKVLTFHEFFSAERHAFLQDNLQNVKHFPWACFDAK
jgi:hypothetical protein